MKADHVARKDVEAVLDEARDKLNPNAGDLSSGPRTAISGHLMRGWAVPIPPMRNQEYPRGPEGKTT
jgi:hypothetical protein